MLFCSFAPTLSTWTSTKKKKEKKEKKKEEKQKLGQVFSVVVVLLLFFFFLQPSYYFFLFNRMAIDIVSRHIFYGDDGGQLDRLPLCFLTAVEHVRQLSAAGDRRAAPVQTFSNSRRRFGEAWHFLMLLSVLFSERDEVSLGCLS